MLEKIIPIADRRDSNETLPIPSRIESATGLVTYKLFRPLRDLRISVTDRCNFRCVYCMPKDVFNQNYTFLPPSSFLSFEEITRIASLFVAHGVEKIRLTGGEPLLRKNIEKLIKRTLIWSRIWLKCKSLSHCGNVLYSANVNDKRMDKNKTPSILFINRSKASLL